MSEGKIVKVELLQFEIFKGSILDTSDTTNHMRSHSP
jgi:hypothetical protein